VRAAAAAAAPSLGSSTLGTPAAPARLRTATQPERSTFKPEFIAAAKATGRLHNCLCAPPAFSHPKSMKITQKWGLKCRFPIFSQHHNFCRA